MPKTLKCCIQGCHENSRNLIEDISFHRIPKDLPTRNQWIDLIRSKTNQPNVFSIGALVCSKHFDKSEFTERVNGSRVLTSNSLPSIFPNVQTESFKQDWSDNEDNEIDAFPDPLHNDALASPKLLQPFNDTSSTTKMEVNVDIYSDPIFIKREYIDDDNEFLRTMEGSDFRKHCRFCLTVPISTQIEQSMSSQDIAHMYKSLTGTEFYTSEQLALVTICTDCSMKLKNAFDLRAHLIRMNYHWETFMKNNDAIKMAIDESKPVEPESTAILPLETEHTATQPTLEVVILNENSELQAIEEYLELDDDFADDISEELDENEDEDEKFIRSAQDFIKTVKPTKPTALTRIQKPSGKLLTNKSAKKISADTERLNFRSSSSPHSSQKLKKANKWWRLMHDCNYCDAGDFLTVEAVNKHLKLQHADLVKVTCDICKKDYSELKYLVKHMKYVHQRREHECTVCKKRFYYNYNLKSHMQSHTNEKTNICHFCGKFFTLSGLHQHLRTGVHAGQGGPDKAAKNKSQNSKSQRFYCHICVPVKRFQICSELTEHRRLQHKDFECPICKGWFSCVEALENHLKTHSNKERKHICSICSSTFVRASHLEGHMRRKHSSNPKPIACDQCDYRCVEPYELTGHKKHAHSKLRPHKCEHCDKSFTHSQAYKDHILIVHEIGQYRYFCDQCPKKFVNSAGLIHHRGVHHNGAGNAAS